MKENNTIAKSPIPIPLHKQHCEHISAVFFFRSFTTCWCSRVPSLTAQTDWGKDGSGNEEGWEKE